MSGPIEMYRPLEPLERSVLALLVRGWTSPLQALNEANCFSLSQRVSTLSRLGYRIEKAWLPLPSGKRVRQYRVAPLTRGTV